jgi:hypothetical protein
MTAIDRRAMLGTLLGAAAAAALGLTLTPGPAESAPLTLDKGLTAPASNLVEEAVVVVHHRHRGPVVRRRRRHVCWWHRGRRVCGWR